VTNKIILCRFEDLWLVQYVCVGGRDYICGVYTHAHNTKYEYFMQVGFIFGCCVLLCVFVCVGGGDCEVLGSGGVVVTCFYVVLYCNLNEKFL